MERWSIVVTADKARALSGVTPKKEKSQFDSVFAENWQKICRVIVRIVGDADEAQDLALETFWQLYRRPPTNDSAQNLGGWLYRVATNLGLNALRSRKRRAQYETQAGMRRIENDSSTDTFDVVTAEEERMRVRAVLGQMDERQAQLLILRYSGLSYKELATTLGVSANSIGTLLVRAEREFEKRYKE